MSRIFLAGAAGVIGRRLMPLLRASGHSVWGTTRSPERVEFLRGLGAHPVLVDVFDPGALAKSVLEAKPEIVIHQLTDLAETSRSGEARQPPSPAMPASARRGRATWSRRRGRLARAA